MPHELLSTKQAAERLGISKRTLETLRQVGNGPSYLKLGRAVRYQPSEIDSWLLTLAFNSTAQAKRAEADRV